MDPTGITGITGIVLAGGEGRRMGGLEKGLQPFQGRALLEWIIERLTPQVDEVLISANRDLDSYRRHGLRVVTDPPPSGKGPLGGLLAGMLAASRPWVLSVPCDAPHLPRDLALRLKQGLDSSAANCAVASVRGRRQPVFCLASRSLAPHLEDFIARGELAVHAWQQSADAVEVAFDDAADAFVPLNTLEALLRASHGD